MWGTRDDTVPIPQPFCERVLRNRRATLGPRLARGILSRDPDTYPGLPASYRGFTDRFDAAVVVIPRATVPEFHAGLPPSMQEYGR